jgi:hypothetical protein
MDWSVLAVANTWQIINGDLLEQTALRGEGAEWQDRCDDGTSTR